MIKKHYPFLDGLLAYAVLWVLIAHINKIFDLRQPLGNLFKSFCRFAFEGSLGVDIFFVLSGFLITGILISDFNATIDIKRFYIRRFFKIVPQYFLAVFAAFIISRTLPYTEAKGLLWVNTLPDKTIIAEEITYPSHLPNAHFISHLLFYQNFTVRVPILAHTWSLAVEEHFYAVYPLLLALIFLFFKTPRLRKRALLSSLFILILISHSVRAFYIYKLHYLNDINTLFRFDALIFGCLIRLLEKDITEIPLKHQALLSPCCLLTGIYIFSQYISIQHFSNFLIGSPVFYYTLSYLASGLVIIALLMNQIAWIGYFFENNFLCWIGKNSYGLYLWHYILIFPFYRLVTHLGTVSTIILYTVTTFLVGTLSTMTIERYFLKIREKVIP